MAFGSRHSGAVSPSLMRLCIRDAKMFGNTVVFSDTNGVGNRKEVALKNKIRNLKSILKQKGGKRLFLSEEAEENIKREIQDTEFELEHGGYYDPIEEGFEEQMDQALSQSAFGSSFVFADGGFATMEDVLGYSNE